LLSIPADIPFIIVIVGDLRLCYLQASVFAVLWIERWKKEGRRSCRDKEKKREEAKVFSFKLSPLARNTFIHNHSYSTVLSLPTTQIRDTNMVFVYYQYFFTFH
jgi:hypothetical protein